MCEPEETILLAQLILQEGFRTNPDPGGTEKVSVCDPAASCRTIYGTVGKYASIREQVMANRGISMSSAATRRAPNCFHFLRQVECLTRAGLGNAKQQFDWSNATAVSKAFSIGKLEAAAVSNLQSHVEPSLVKRLKEVVATRGLRSFLGHDVFGRGVFNTGWSSGSGSCEAWVSVMTNLDDGALANLLIDRICADYDAQPVGMRKALTAKEVTTTHQHCAIFLSFLNTLQKTIPSSDAAAAKEKLTTHFFLGALDAELGLIAESTIPPGDLKSVGAFRSILSNHEKKVSDETEERVHELKQKVFQATFEQLKAQVEEDLRKIRAALPTKATQALETSKDMKYIRDRQQHVMALVSCDQSFRKGNEYVKNWMSSQCKIAWISVKDDAYASTTMANSLSEFTRYVLCSVDATVWPSSTQYLLDCLALVQNVCSLGTANVSHIQMPMFHQATTMNALIKHRRKVEDSLLKSDLDFTQSLTLMFSKDESRQGMDKRPLTQSCVIAFSGKACRWLESEAIQSAVIASLPLLKVSEMVGFAEFGTACVQRSLEEKTPPVLYYGIFRDDSGHKKTFADLQTSVFQHWDGLPSSPPKTRPRAKASLHVDNLSLLSCTATGPVWPEGLTDKFPADSAHRKELEALRNKFLEEFPPPKDTAGAGATTPRVPVRRVSGEPDFTIEDSRRPIDINRNLDPTLEAPPAPADRTATVAGKSGKPSIIIDKDMKIWIGNESDSAMSLKPTELFGFNTGAFEFKIVRGSNKRDSSGIAWRITSDLDLISWDKKVMPVCEFLHICAVSHGLADVGIPEHTTSPKLHAAAASP
ncbi:unnamed protein product [Durusdinium trenchii]|uniref:Uncharacterized protein n=1 Tax=Durusdinium trenchii TaxID=1381693 RepID=A0ABP0RNK3_9DINO